MYYRPLNGNVTAVLESFRSTKTMQPTYSRLDKLTFIQWSVYRVYKTYSSSDQQQLEVAEKPRADRSEVS